MDFEISKTKKYGSEVALMKYFWMRDCFFETMHHFDILPPPPAITAQLNVIF